jgi:signal transduction histidine kinase
MSTTASNSKIRVLLIDDDQDDYLLTRELLAEVPDRAMEVEWVKDYESGLNACCAGTYDVALLDYKLGPRTGLDLLREARARGGDVPIIFLTGLTNPEIDLAAMQSGAVDFLEKARLDATILSRAIRYALQQKQTEAELERRVRERTEELDRVNETLRTVDRRKDEFIATLAHELRNPLVPIRNALEIMRLAKDAAGVVASSRSIIERQVSHLVRLIDDLLDVSRLTRNKLHLTSERLVLSDVLDAAIEQSRPLLDKSGQTLTVDIPREPISITGDRVRLAQVFANLLNNSARYSEPGGQVTLVVSREQDKVAVRVCDTGIGIASDMLAKLFEPFAQAERPHHRSPGGLGIGLSLVRQLVELHGGTVSAHSDGVARGAEFIVILPCTTEGACPPETQTPDRVSG